MDRRQLRCGAPGGQGIRPGHEDPGLLEAGVDREAIPERLREETRADEQQDRQCDLQDYECVAESPGCRSVGAGALPGAADEVDTSAFERRRHPKEKELDRSERGYTGTGYAKGGDAENVESSGIASSAAC